MFAKNVGNVDRIVRFIAAAALIAGGFFVTGVLAIVLWVLGGIMVLTGAIGFCPLYLPFGIKTTGGKK